MDDHWDIFEEKQQAASDKLEAAEDRYEELTAVVGDIPESIPTALSQTREESEQLDDILDVSPDDAEQARELEQRVELLEVVLDAMADFQTNLLEKKIALFEQWYDSLASEASRSADDIERGISTLWEAVNLGKYEQVQTDGDWTLSILSDRVYEHDAEIRPTVSETVYVSYCLETAEKLMDHATDDLTDLVREDVSISIKSERAAIEEFLDSARDRRESNDIDSETIETARTGLEGALMLRYQVAYEQCAYRYCQRLGEILNNNDAVDDETSFTQAVENRSVRRLEDQALDVIDNEAMVSIDEQILYLLRENDASVQNALGASNIGTDTFFDGLQTGYETGEIADVEVRFE